MNALRVLIADDDGQSRASLASQVEHLGYQVVAMARDGGEAVRQAIQTKPDLILMDIKMPVMDGLQATRAIMQVRPVPIILLSGFSEQDLTRDAVDAGVQAYLVKPISIRELAPTMALAHARFQQQGRAQARPSLPGAELHSASPAVEDLVRRMLAEPDELRVLLVYRNRGLAWWEESDLIAFAGGDPKDTRAAISLLVQENLLETRRAAGLTFYNITSDPNRRHDVDAFFTWLREAGERIEAWRHLLGPEINTRNRTPRANHP
jgi:CheY-like chemotaxis protein